MRTHLIENYQALRDRAPCLSRAATLPKATKLGLGRGAHLKTPSSANHTAATSQPTGRIAKAASWLHLSRVSPALHPPERPSHTHTPKPGFGGRGHESVMSCHVSQSDPRFTTLVIFCRCPLQSISYYNNTLIQYSTTSSLGYQSPPHSRWVRTRFGEGGGQLDR